MDYDKSIKTRRKTRLLEANPVTTSTPSNKRARFCNYTHLLPNEILLYIFSFLSHEDLYKNVRCTCKRWYVLASTPTLWKTIKADKNVPTNVLCKWIQESPLLEEICISNRNDMNTIAKKISKYSPNLRTMVVKNCWGTSKTNTIHGKILCKIVKKCRKLNNFNFSQINIRSSKFFGLLATKRGPNKQSKCSYCGPISRKQIEALVESLIKNQHFFVSSLSAGKPKRVSLNHVLNLQSPVAALAARDLWERILQSNQNENVDNVANVD